MEYVKKILYIVWTGVFLFLSASSIPAFSQEPKLKVVTEVANIRSQPDIGSSILYQAEKNSLLEYLDRSGEWFKIRFQPEEGEPLTGYVHESLVVELFPLPDEKEQKEDPRQETPPEKEIPPKIKIIPPEEKPVEPEKIPPAVKPSPPPYYLSIKGGFHYTNSGDLNSGAAGLADFYQDRLNASDPLKPDPHHVNYMFGADISFPLNSWFYLGVGADYYSGKTGTEIPFRPQDNKIEITTRPGLKALPVHFAADVFLTPALYLRAGIEYIFASCSYYYRFSQGDYWQEWKGEAEAQAPGLLAGVGFTQKLNQFLDIFIEATGRYAKISRFKGTDTYQDSTGLSNQEKGYLYLFQAQTAPEKTFDLLFIRDRKPSEAGVLNPQRATVDFSGVSIVFGLKFRF